jgi:hypothetical protein
MIPPSTTPPSPATPERPPSGPAAEDCRVDTALASLEALAVELQEQPEALLALLRRLEQLHRQIQDGPFRASLPEDRNRLFALLEEMERSGGWPYIPRLQLRTFLGLLQREGTGSDSLAA